MIVVIISAKVKEKKRLHRMSLLYFKGLRTISITIYLVFEVQSLVGAVSRRRA